MRASDGLAWTEGGYVARAAEQLRSDPTTVARRLRRSERVLDRKLVERIKAA
ncbi:hypothetical protein MWU52_06790 [Jannaschia sp. S6380]|uniref:hypothetical protein n=1 Tax=Jannaschia sp. S6380 TaxID=2926408 RepID=UPI001FF5E7CF|nr:hypothetical protein [Jannaschia sp. S6380]MCK0167252.1 hypothetical protein [Jannaschia sp. S6380]